MAEPGKGTPVVSDDATMRAYYEARAAQYDRAYEGEAPAWVGQMVADLQQALRGRHVLEIACGTGHWTRYAAAVAARVSAADTAPAMRALASAKLADLQNVTIFEADAYELRGLDGPFDGGLAMQWLSHVRVARRHAFFTGWHACLDRGSVVFLGDNQPSEQWTSEPVDTYERRELDDGSSYLVLKNYFTESDLRSIIAAYGEVLTLTMGERWWWLSYRLHGRPSRPDDARR
jgi:cyclopropane fatty-acyl-phospholipid synthase-like methyltransferase